MSIIDKLEIKPLRKTIVTDGVHAVGIEVYNDGGVEELEQQIKGLVEFSIDILTGEYAGIESPLADERFKDDYNDIISLIEKIADKTWEEIQELCHD